MSPSPSKVAFFEHARSDLTAGLVVFLVAVPLCLGIASASGAPPFAGLLAGIIGGIVVGVVSGSPLSVSGPAAGLTFLVFTAIQELGYPAFLLAVVLAGALQILMGLLKSGVIAHFFPGSVIKGMLAAIGIILILKQLPHALGHDSDFEGDESFRQLDGENTFSELLSAFGDLQKTAIVVSLVGLAVLWLWPHLQKRAKFLKLVPSSLVVVVMGPLVALLMGTVVPDWKLEPIHLVGIPVLTTLSDLPQLFQLPDFAQITKLAIWKHAAILAFVASIETLLSLEAVDQIDPDRRISPPNRELFAQGVGNGLSGLLGGIPLTAVIVRSSANLEAGGKTRLSAITHGMLLLLGTVLFSKALNLIPLASLAVVLLAVGYKLTKPSLYLEMWKGGLNQFVPFLVTVVAVVFTDLLKGTLIGLAVGVIFVIVANQRDTIVVTKDGDMMLLKCNKDLTFLSKAKVKEALRLVPDNTTVIIDGHRVDFIDRDISEVFRNFANDAKRRGIDVSWKFAPRILTRTLQIAAEAK